jgi:hypothetical protein
MLMRTGMSFTVLGEDRSQLETVISHPCSPQKRVWRCRIASLSRDNAGTASILVIRSTQDAPPHEATHWTFRAMGKAVELNGSTEYVGHVW